MSGAEQEEQQGQAEAVQVLSEAELDAPSRQALIMLAVICVTTLICWAAGRAACNYHVPGESLTPRKTTLAERTHSAKAVGVEFGQALAGGDFETAKLLARAEGLAFVEQEKAACKDLAARTGARKKLLTVAQVLEANSVDAIVEVKTLGGPSGEATRLLGIERHERDHRVTRVFASRAEAKLILPPEPTEPTPTEEGGPAAEGAPTEKNGPPTDPEPAKPGSPEPESTKSGSTDSAPSGKVAPPAAEN